MEISIRRAQPADVHFAVPLIHSSGPHEFDFIFNAGNRTAREYLSFVFPTRLGNQSHRVCHVATLNNQVVGIGAFYTGRDNLGLSLENSWNVLRFYGPFRMLIVEQRASRLERLLPPPDADAGLICQLGVRQEFRGQGIGSALLQYAIGQARSVGLGRCVLDVAVTNPRAQALYERMGFKVIQESKWKNMDVGIQLSGQRRMELVL